jgi:hypothetical protein
MDRVPYHVVPPSAVINVSTSIPELDNSGGVPSGHFIDEGQTTCLLPPFVRISEIQAVLLAGTPVKEIVVAAEIVFVKHAPLETFISPAVTATVGPKIPPVRVPPDIGK